MVNNVVMLNLPTIDKCFGCGVCVDACPKNAIQQIEDPNGFYIPKVDNELCIKCGICEQKCPSLHQQNILRNSLENQQIYAAWSTNENIVKRSASGGVFAQVASEFLEQPNRVVYGATLLENSAVKHIFIENSKDIHLLQNSKY